MNQSITNISVEVLKVHPRNTEFFDDISGEEYERFKKSIDEDGLLSPLVVAPDMTVISGHQRLKACKELGHKSVPVIINESLEDEDEKLKTLIAANFGRLKNDPIKQGKLIKEYMRLSGVGSSGRPKKTTDNRSIIKRDDIAKELGISTTQLNDIKRLTTLIPEFQDIISEGKITATTGYKVLAKLSEEDQQKLLSQLPVSQKFTQKQVEEYVNQIQEKDNIIAGYKMKLESKAKEPDEPLEQSVDMAQLLDEKQALEAEKRQWYEKAQSYKKEVEESKTALDKAKAMQAKETIVEIEKIIEVEKAPADYEKIKRELAEANRELVKSKAIIKNIPPNPKIATSFGAKDLTQILEHFSNSISAFQFADDALNGCDPQESFRIQELIEEAKKEFDVIASKLKGKVA